MIYSLLKAKRNPHANIISYVNREAEQNLHLQLNFYMPPNIFPFHLYGRGENRNFAPAKPSRRARENPSA